MGKKRRRRDRRRPKPFYQLSEIKDLVRRRKVFIRKNALDGARAAFGWGPADILDALAKLQLKHFYKSDVSRIDKRIVLDYYKARRLKGEQVYTHFYIAESSGKLIVNSFKEI